MNDLLDEVWDESIVRLAIGLRLVDAVRGGRPIVDIHVAMENVPKPHPIPPPPPQGPDLGVGLPTLSPKRSGRFVVLYPVSKASPLTLRVFDRRRRFAPRRLKVPFPTKALVEAEDRASRVDPYPPVTPRGRAVALYPGAMYDGSGITGIRSQIVRPDGTPVQWARVWATNLTGNRTEGVAHADDRGEFLLLLRSTNVLLTSAPRMTRDVVLHAAIPPATADSPGDPKQDPLSSLPVELLPDVGSPDDVSPGEVVPATYSTSNDTAVITCRLGRVTTREPLIVT
jgi:hypothetical protein